MRIPTIFFLRLVVSAAIVAAAAAIVERQNANSEALALELVEAESVDVGRNVQVLLESARLALDNFTELAVGGDTGLKIDPRLDTVMDTTLARNPFAVGAIVQDSTGRIVAAAAPRTALGADGSAYPAFAALAAGKLDGYFVGPPLRSPVFGKDLIAVAHAIKRPDGGPAGVVSIGLDLAAVRAAMRPNLPRTAAVARLWGTDGILLASSLDDGVATGTAYPDLPLFAKRSASQPAGAFVAVSPLTGTRRITAWRNSTGFPVFVAVVAEYDEILRPLRIGTSEIVLVAGLLLVLLWTIVFLSEREAKRRQALLRQAEAARDAAIAAKRDAEIANTTKSRLLANLSHEFRTPLNAILGFTEMVRLGYKGPIQAAAGENLDLVLGSARHLNSLVGSLLEISRLELDPEALNLAQGDVAPAIADAVSMVRAQSDRRLVRLHVVSAGVPEFAFDRIRVLQALVNLLANAARHSPEGGAVSVTARVGGRPDGRTVEIRVEDSGPGIPAEFLETVFEPFGNHALVARRPESMGLGLAISRQIARAHGGDLRLENRAEGGLAAILTLPLDGPQAAASA